MTTQGKLAAALLLSLMLQMLLHWTAPWEGARTEKLKDPPDPAILRIASLDETVMMSRFMMLYLQSSDIQPGVIIPFRDLDYGVVTKWLEESLLLDGRDEYPLFAATHIYLGLKDPEKEKPMLDFIYREFLKNPSGRWQWLTGAILDAKYDLHDLKLAMEYSEALRKKANGAPVWAREMSIFVLEGMNELDSAKVLLGGLLVEGKIRDPNEVAFLQRELERIGKIETKR